MKTIWNTKVRLREHKRHTAYHVASARFVDRGVPDPVLDGEEYAIQSWTGSTPSSLGLGYPIMILDGGTSHQQDGIPPVWTWDGYPQFLRHIGLPPYQKDGVPPPSRPEIQYPPSFQTWDGVSPSPASVDRL